MGQAPMAVCWSEQHTNVGSKTFVSGGARSISHRPSTGPACLIRIAAASECGWRGKTAAVAAATW